MTGFKISVLIGLIALIVLVPWAYLHSVSYESYSWGFVAALIVFVAIPLNIKNMSNSKSR